MSHDTPEAIAITDKAAMDLIELLKNGKLMKSLESNDLFKWVQFNKATKEQAT